MPKPSPPPSPVIPSICDCSNSATTTEAERDFVQFFASLEEGHGNGNSNHGDNVDNDGEGEEGEEEEESQETTQHDGPATQTCHKNS